MLLQFLVNVAFFGGAYFFGERAWAQAKIQSLVEAPRASAAATKQEIIAATK